MKMNFPHYALFVLAVLPLNGGAAPFGTEFTYQGRLSANAGPANGSYDVAFTLYDNVTAGNPVGGSVTNNALPVNNGLFTATLDFGTSAFTGDARWLQIAVRTNGVGEYTTLAPRQRIAPTPYAITASNVVGTVQATQLAGVLPPASLAGTYSAAVAFTNEGNSFAGNGSQLSAVDATSLDGLTSMSFWQLGGNWGTPNSAFIGTTDNQPLEIKVNHTRALRLEPNLNGPANLIGGSRSNAAAPGVIGATISGGGADDGIQQNSIASDYGTIAGGIGNHIDANAFYSTVGGGTNNSLGGTTAVIAGGADNQIAWHGVNSGNTISGGANNYIESSYSTVSGGRDNRASGKNYCVVGGGQSNSVSGTASTVPGGFANTATSFAFAAGSRAKANHIGSFVWADHTEVEIASTNADSVTMRASGGYRLFSDPNATVGAYLGAGEGSWTVISDRNKKENFEAVDSHAILEKIAALPVTTWNYKAQTNGIRHIGPMAQDFKAAFGVGASDTGISTVDADGISLAAIKGLYDMLKERDKEVAQLRQELRSIKAKLKE